MFMTLAGALGSFALGSTPAPASAAAPPGFIVHNDVATGISSDAEVFVSLRYMRHMWITFDGVQVAVVQQGTNGALGLYKSFDSGLSWTWEQDLPSASDDVSDGIMLDDGSLLLVTSLVSTGPVSDVEFIRLDYDACAQEWTIDPLTPTTVYDSNNVAKATRGSIAIDSNGVLWAGFRLQNTNSGNVRLRLFYSVDDGLTWQDSLNVFGTANAWAEKDAKVLATGSGIGVVFQDVTGSAGSPVRSKRWAFRYDSASLQTPMTSQLVGQMVATSGDPYGSHWTVAADSLGNVHLSYQDDRVYYARLDAALQTWSTPVSLGTYSGSYNSLSIAGNDDVYVFARLSGGGNVWVKHLTVATQQWSSWLQVSANPHEGLLRMCSPERVDDELPMLYQVNATAPFELLHCLLDV